MLGRVLVANRGEIARRILRTCRRLQVATVAVCSDIDADEPHVHEADDAVHVGGATPASSYLDIERLVAAAVDRGCDAVHPGYGFLAENADFAEAVAAAGLVFIGPSPHVLRLLGDKAAAKRQLAAAGVPVIAGEDTDGMDDDAVLAAAGRIGAPLVVKAVAGGGGKGMRVVHDLDQLPPALAAARREARTAFGDDRLLLERLVSSPRHVEVQVLGDRHGTVVHLGERECSIQRRHQKLVEESPSPAVDADLRRRMTDAAVTAARSVGYEGAGTVEFLVAGDTLTSDQPEFAFLEVNARLQVEHPVTEFVTGLDLVELQLRVAAGEPLGFDQDDVELRGHAIEVRLCAEDPVEYLPQAGHVLRAELPTDQVRVDSGVETGSDVSAYYDPLLAKLIAAGEDRDAARQRLRAALDATVLHGVVTNLELLRAVLDHPAFGAGELTTGFLSEHLDGWRPPPPDELAWIAAAAALRQALDPPARTEVVRPTPWDTLGPIRPAGTGGWPLHLADGHRVRHVRVHAVADHDRVTMDGNTYLLRTTRPSPDGTLHLDVDGVAHVAQVTVEPASSGTLPPAVWVHLDGRTTRLQVLPVARPADPSSLAGDSVFGSPMPGSVLAVEVAAGERVDAGTTMVVVEAMKMEHPVVAPAAGIVTAVHVSTGDNVDAGMALLAFEADGDGGASGQADPHEVAGDVTGTPTS